MRLTALLILGSLFLTACSKKEEEATATAAPEPPPEAALAIESLVPAKNPSAATIQDRLEGAVHPELTAKLHMFVDTYKRMPESFYEFSGRMMDSVPPVPPGMKYEIDPADKSVKVVKKQ
jgi:hypothetical protein